MACLEKLEDELIAGRLAGRYLIVKNIAQKRSLLDQIPKHLITRVNEIIVCYETLEVEKQAKEIALLPTRIERNKVLGRVDDHLKERVRTKVLEMFSCEREKRKADVHRGGKAMST